MKSYQTRLEIFDLANPHAQDSAALCVLIVFVLLSILSSLNTTSTTDEPNHYAYATQLLAGQSARLDDSSMPISALNAIPKRIGLLIAPGYLRTVLGSFFVARLITILFSTCVAFLVFHWSRSLYGFVPSLFSIVLYVLDPNIIAHSQLVTTDIFIAGLTTLTFYFLWRFANTRRARYGILCALAIGVSQIAKYTALALLPLCILALVLHDWPSLRQGFQAGGARLLGRYVAKIVLYAGFAAVVSAVIINIGFLFEMTSIRLRDYRFKSSLFQSIQADVPALGGLPIPLPYPYLDGLDWTIHTDQTGDRFGYLYLLGHLSKQKGFPGYYFIANLLKEPIATQVIVTASLVAIFATRKRRADVFQHTVFFLVPVVFYAIYYNFFFNAQIGIRYYLVMFPLLCVLSGTLFVQWQSFSLAWRAISLALAAYLAVSVLSYFPRYIPYFNELVWDKTTTYRYLSDSNLEWGQSRNDLRRYLADHPDAIYAPDHLQPGLLVINANDLVGVSWNPREYEWLRNNFRPEETIAYEYFVFRISPAEAAKSCAPRQECP